MALMAGISLFVFDLDGTITKFQIDWQTLKEELKKMFKIDDSLTPLIPSIEALEVDPEVKKAIYRMIDQAEIEAAENLKPDRKVKELFKKLKELSFDIALVTLQGHMPADKALKKLGISKYFDFVVSRDERKDREDQISLVLERMETEPSKAIVVGDKMRDMEAARKIGCRTIAISTKPEVDGNLRLPSIEGILSLVDGD